MSTFTCTFSRSFPVICALQDLLADTSTGATRHKPTQGPLAKEHAFTNKQVLGAADFKNLQFLNAFVSNGGQILPRSKTKLQAKVHRHLARQIKTARIMALLPHSGGHIQDVDPVCLRLLALMCPCDRVKRSPHRCQVADVTACKNGNLC